MSERKRKKNELVMCGCLLPVRNYGKYIIPEN